MQEICDVTDQGRLYFDSADVFHRIEIVEHSAVHRNDGEAQVDSGQDLADSGGGLLGGDREAHTVMEKAVEFNLCETAEFPVLPEEYVINARHKERFAVPDSRKVERVDKDRHAYADDRLQGTVEDVYVGIRVLNVVYRDAQKDNSGKESVLRDVQKDGGVDHQTCEDSEQDIKDHSGAEAAALGQEFQK